MPTNQAATPSGAEILSFNTLTQVQSDWSQSNTSEPSYIRNKPTIPDPLPTSTSADAGKVLTVDSTGAPAWSNTTYNETVLGTASEPGVSTEIVYSESLANFERIGLYYITSDNEEHYMECFDTLHNAITLVPVARPGSGSSSIYFKHGAYSNDTTNSKIKHWRGGEITMSASGNSISSTRQCLFVTKIIGINRITNAS